MRSYGSDDADSMEIGDTDPHNFDIAFVVDVSGSMWGERITNAKDVLNNFIQCIHAEDEVALIAFHSYANLICDFTNDKSDLMSKVQLLATGGNTDVNKGLVEALSIFSKKETEDEKNNCPYL